MSLTAATTADSSPSAEEASSSSSSTPSSTAEIHLPAEIDWEMLDKWRFFVLGAALFSGVSAALYPAVVIKTHLQVSRPPLTCTSASANILRSEGPKGFYRGFATSLAGTVPARALYMAALELTKSSVASAAAEFGVPDPAAAAAASAVAGLSAAVAAQAVWTPVDVVSQRLMVGDSKYTGGIDAVRKIVSSSGIRGLYRGFGMSILTYAPSNAVWWGSYSVAQRMIWGGISQFYDGNVTVRPQYGTVAVVQGLSAAMAGGAAAVVTMPLDTIKTRMQVIDADDGNRSVLPGAGATVGVDVTVSDNNDHYLRVLEETVSERYSSLLLLSLRFFFYICFLSIVPSFLYLCVYIFDKKRNRSLVVFHMGNLSIQSRDKFLHC